MGDFTIKTERNNLFAKTETLDEYLKRCMSIIDNIIECIKLGYAVHIQEGSTALLQFLQVALEDQGCQFSALINEKSTDSFTKLKLTGEKCLHLHFKI